MRFLCVFLLLAAARKSEESCQRRGAWSPVGGPVGSFPPKISSCVRVPPCASSEAPAGPQRLNFARPEPRDFRASFLASSSSSRPRAAGVAPGAQGEAAGRILVRCGRCSWPGAAAGCGSSARRLLSAALAGTRRSPPTARAGGDGALVDTDSVTAASCGRHERRAGAHPRPMACARPI